MLVINGRLHPRFDENGISQKIRNGIGVRGGETVVFAISRSGVSFGSFARLFRDALDCPDALYLDGSIATLTTPGIGRVGGFPPMPLGPIIAAFDRS
jgi:uncharacterized protein YigE (DUF2233 family)